MSDRGYKEIIDTTKDYYNSHDAHTFYHMIWGGEEHHLGIYRTPEDSVYEASRRIIGHMSSFSDHLDENTKLLDLGSGMGGTPRYLAKTYHCQVTGLNLSEVENDRHRRKNEEQWLDKRIEVVDGNFEDVPFPDESFDIVWSQDSLLHSPDRKKVLSEAHRVLKKGGELIFTDPMQTEDAYTEFIQPILKRIHLANLATPIFYFSTAKEIGFEFAGYENLAQQLTNHYTKILKDTESREEELKANGVSQNYLDNMKEGLFNWVVGGKYGHLTWAVFCFHKQ